MVLQVFKLLEGLIMEKLQNYNEKHLNDAQFGFRSIWWV